MPRDDMKAKSILFQVGVMFVGVAKGLASIKLMVGFGVDHFAMLSQFMVLATFATQVFLWGYDTPFVAKHATGENSSSAYLAILWLQGFNFIALLLAFIFFKGQFSEFVWGDAKYASYLYALLVYISLLSLNLTTLLRYQAERRFDRYALFQVAQSLLQLLAILIGTLLENMVTIVVLLIVFEGALFGFTASQIISKKIFSTGIEKPLKWLSNNLTIAKSMLVSFLMIWILNNGGRFIVVGYQDLGYLASYAATYSIAVLAGVLINPVCSVFFPYFCCVSDSEKQNTEKTFLVSQLALLVMGGILGIGVIAMSRSVLSTLAPPELFAGEKFVLCICLAQIFYGQARICSLYLTVNGLPKTSQIAFILGAVFFIFSGIFLIQPWGSLGVVVALTLGMLIAGLTAWGKLMSSNNIFYLLKNKRIFYYSWIITVIYLVIVSHFSTSSILQSAAIASIAVITYILFIIILLYREPIFLELLKKYNLWGLFKIA